VLLIKPESIDLCRPRGIFADGNDLYIADSGNKRILKVNMDASN
jgi:hypothetical protein